MDLRILILIYILLSGIYSKGILAQDCPTLIQIRNNYYIFNDGLDSVQIKNKQNRTTQIVYFLFAAEEDPIGLDPGLSIDGRWRSMNLLNIFREVEIGAFFSTPFRRNVLTIQPLTENKKATITYYDQADLKSLFNQIEKLAPRDVIVMAHKETLPKIIEHYTKSVFSEKIDNQPSDRIFVLERKLSGAAIIRTFGYNIR